MSYKRCEVCQAIIGEQTEEGFIIRSECHKEIIVKGLLEIQCKNNHKNLVYSTNGKNTKQEPEGDEYVKDAR